MTSWFDPIRRELDAWQDMSLRPQLWIRDDDAVTVSPQLERFADTLRPHGIVPILAVIPASLREDLPDFVHAKGWAVAVHGWAHTNHATAGEKKCEFGAARARFDVEDEFRRGRQVVAARFKDAALPVFVPPWNRIAAPWLDVLSVCGFKLVSTFANNHVDHAGPGAIQVLNTRLDLIDWRGGRQMKSLAQLAQEMANCLSECRMRGRRELGLLTHHLEHGSAATQTFEAFLSAISDDGRCYWLRPDEVFTDRGSASEVNELGE